ncbi:DUF4268 domain-containing protein [Halpernia sp. GG3]
MFSKEEAANLKKEFWTAFGKSFPKKWLLYDTKIKDLSFKFNADNRKAEVSLNIEMQDEVLRNAYFEKIQSLENLFLEEMPELIFDENFPLENGKIISKIWVEKGGVSLFNKNSWREIFEFFFDNMEKMEQLFFEYEDYIKDV